MMKKTKSLLLFTSCILLSQSLLANKFMATTENLKENPIPFEFFTGTPVWHCNLEPINFRLQKKALKRSIKRFFYTSYRTFDFSQRQDKNGNPLLYNTGNTWAHEFRSFPSKSGNTLRSVGDWEPPEHAREGVKAENVMTLNYFKNHFVAQLEEHVHQLKAGTQEIERSEVIPVSILYCYSEKYLTQSLLNMGDNVQDIAQAKDMQQKREYLDGRPESPQRTKELRSLNTQAKKWLRH